MKTMREMISVMQAYERGEQIEIFINGEWKENYSPMWNWLDFDYRVKPKKKYVPFDTAEEFLAAQRAHGDLCNINTDDCSLHAFVNCDGRVITYRGDFDFLSYSMKELFEHTFEDGTPCGKEVEE